MNVSLYAYQSFLARNLCELWFLDSSESDNRKVLEEEEFNTFVKQEVQDLSIDEAFYEVVNVFFARARKGTDLSSAIPATRMMEKLREEHMIEAYKQEEKARAGLLKSRGLDWLKKSDLMLVAEKATKKLKERGKDFFPTKEEINKALEEELALFKERMKVKE